MTADCWFADHFSHGKILSFNAKDRNTKISLWKNLDVENKCYHTEKKIG